MNTGEYKVWVNDRISDFERHNHKYSIMNIIDKLYSDKYFVCKKRHGIDYGCGSIIYGNFIIAWDEYERTVTIHHNKYHTYAVAKCKFNDKFDLRTGIAIAWAKYNNMTVPDIDNTINRDNLQNGDIFISSVNDDAYIFIGWIPNWRKGIIGKWAIVLDDKGKALKTQIAEEVIKIN